MSPVHGHVLAETPEERLVSPSCVSAGIGSGLPILRSDPTPAAGSIGDSVR